MVREGGKLRNGFSSQNMRRPRVSALFIGCCWQMYFIECVQYMFLIIVQYMVLKNASALCLIFIKYLFFQNNIYSVKKAKIYK